MKTHQILTAVLILLSITLSNLNAQNITGKWANDTEAWEFLPEGYFSYSTAEISIFGNYSIENGILYCGAFPFSDDLFNTQLTFFSYDIYTGNNQLQLLNHADNNTYSYQKTGAPVGLFLLTASQGATMYGTASKPNGYTASKTPKASSSTPTNTNTYTLPPTSPSNSSAQNINIVGAWQTEGEFIEFTESGFFHSQSDNLGETYGTYQISNGQMNISFWPNASGSITTVSDFTMDIKPLSKQQFQLSISNNPPSTYTYQGKHRLTSEDIALLVQMSQKIHRVNMNIINGINNDYEYVEVDENGNRKY